METSETAKNIVKAILIDLKGRSGVGDEIDAIDEDIMEELTTDLEIIVDEHLKKEDSDAEHF